MQELSGESLNIVEENIKKLKEIFPEVFEEGKIDFEKLENELGKFIDKESERYNFTWSGKQNAKKIAQTPSTGTLRPCPEESKNWGEYAKPLYRRRQPRSAQTFAKVVSQKSQNDLHRPAVQHRQRVHLPRQLP